MYRHCYDLQIQQHHELIFLGEGDGGGGGGGWIDIRIKMHFILNRIIVNMRIFYAKLMLI